MFKKMILVLSTLLICSTVMANAESPVRATKLSPELINKIQKGEVINLVIEFRKGDQIPINLKAVGDLFESTDSNPTFVEVKKDFYINIKGPEVNMSFDGVNYKPYNKVIRGSLVMNTPNDNPNGDSPATAINMIFSLFLK